jgi:hypothetical protein
MKIEREGLNGPKRPVPIVFGLAPSHSVEDRIRCLHKLDLHLFNSSQFMPEKGDVSFLSSRRTYFTVG